MLIKGKSGKFQKIHFTGKKRVQTSLSCKGRNLIVCVGNEVWGIFE
jgi:hypothetical protein